jgi:hypothetical protein
MTYTHTVDWAGETHKRTSKSRVYTHAVAVVEGASARHGYEWPEKSYILSWASSEKLAQKAAQTARNRAYYTRVEVLPATVVSKDLDPKRLAATLTKRAVKEGQRAVYWATLPEAPRFSNDMVADFAGSAARWAVSNANKALAAQAGHVCPL